MGLYYVIQTFGEALALDDLLPAALAPWLPNLFFAALGCFVLLRAKHPPDH